MTETGSFKVIEKELNHHSNIYGRIVDRYGRTVVADADVDTQQFNLTPYKLFFPEKRPFFLENSNFFTTPINLVFTRRIAHPEYGLRLTGKSGPWAVGVLASDDRAPGDAAVVADSRPARRMDRAQEG